MGKEKKKEWERMGTRIISKETELERVGKMNRREKRKMDKKEG